MGFKRGFCLSLFFFLFCVKRSVGVCVSLYLSLCLSVCLLRSCLCVLAGRFVRGVGSA